MNKPTFLSLALLCSSLTHELYAQDVNLDEDTKLKKYHTVLIKRPESTNLFEKFYSNWLSKYSEESLEKFLKSSADEGAVANMQIYAYFMMQRGREVEALKVLTSAVASDGKNAQVYLDRARVYSRLLDFDKAVLDVDEALKLESEDDLFTLKANKLKGRYLTRQGLADEAVEHWSKLAKENPKDQELIEDVIDILMGDGLYQAALDHAEKLRTATRDPYKKALRTLRVADILQKKGDRDKALAVYKENLKLAGANSWLEREVVAQIESLFRKEENLEGLKKELEEFAKEYPQRVQITQKLADFYSETNEHKKAQELYLDIIKRSPNDAELKNGLLQALEKAGNHEASRDLIISMIQLLPKDAELEIKLAEVYDKLKKKDKALEHLSLYLAKSDKNAASAERYASLLRGLSYQAEAIIAFQDGIKAYPNSEEIKFSAAEYFVLVDKKAEAIELWDSLAKSKNVETVIKLIDVLLFNSEKEKALKLVTTNEDKFKTNKSFINSAIGVAQANKAKPEIIKYSKISLQLAESPTEIDASILKFTRALEKLNSVDLVLKDLKVKKNLSNKEQFLLISLLDVDGEHAESQKMMQELTKGKDIAALLISVRVHERRYELAEAAEIMERILTLPEGLKATYLKQLSSIYENYGNVEDALKTALRWKKLTPNDKSAWLSEVALLESLGKSSEALDALRRGVERFEEEEDIQAKLAFLYFENSNFAQASRIYWKLYDNSKDLDDRIRWVSELSKVATAHNTMSQLIDTLSERRRTSPQAVAPVMALAEVYRSEERYEERRNLLMEATRLRPDDSTILLEVVKSDLSQGQRASAIKVLKNAQKVDKTNTSTKRLAKLYFEDNDYQQGMAELEKLTAGKLNARTLENLVMDLIKQQAFEEASEYLGQHLGKFPNDGRLRLLSSIIDYEIGFVEKSFESILTLLNSDYEMNGVKTGWKIEDYLNIYNGFQPNDSLSQIAKSITAAPSVMRQIASLGGSANHHYRFYPQAQAGNSVLPLNKESLRLMAVLHACRALNDVSGEMKSQWEVKLNDAGVKYIEIWKTQLNNANAYQNPDGLKLYLSNLNDPVYAELAIQHYIRTFTVSVPEELYNKMLEMKGSFSGRQKAIVNYWSIEGVSKEEHSKQIIEQLSKNEEVDTIGLLAYIWADEKLMRGDKMIDSTDIIAPFIVKFLEQNKELANSKINPYQQNAKASIKAQVYPWISAMNDGMILQGEDYKKIVELIESSDRDKNNFFGSYSRRSNQRKDLLLPYSDLTSVTSYQTGLVVKSSRNRRSSYGMLGGQGVLDFEELVKESDSFKNPILKFLVANSSDPEGDHLAILDQAVEDEKYQADAWLLKASAAHRKKEGAEKVATYLEKAKSASTNKLQRQAMDHYLVAAGMSLKKGEEIKSWDKTVKQSVQSAGRRLLLGRKITDPNLIELTLTKLDMLDEKHRYLTKSRKSVRSATSNKGGIMGMARATRSQQNSQQRSTKAWDKATELLKKEQKEDAVRLLSNAFIKSSKSNNSDYEISKIKEVAKKHKLEGDILAFINPKDAVSPRKWVNYFHVADAFEMKAEKDKALKHLKSLTIVPQSLRLPMAIAIHEDSPDRALDLLKGHSNKGKVISEMYNILTERSSTLRNWGYSIRDVKELETKPIDLYLGSLKLIANYVESLNVSDLGNTDYSYGNSFADIQRYLRLPLEGVKAETRKKHAKVFDKVETEVDELFVRISTKGLLNAQSAEKAFEMLHKQYKKKNKLKDLESKLVKSFEIVSSKPAVDLANMHFGSSYSSDAPYPVTRFQFLGEMMLREKSTDALSEDMLNKYVKINSSYGEKLKFLKAHILAEDKEIENLLSKLDEKSEVADLERWDELLKIRNNIDHDSLLLEAIIKITTQDFSRFKGTQKQYSNNQSIKKLIPRVVRSVGVNEKRDEQVVVYLKKLVDEFVKGLDKDDRLNDWLSLMDQNYSSGDEDIRLTLFFAITRELMRSPKGIGLATTLIDDIEYPYVLIGDYSYRYARRQKLSNIDWVKELSSMKFLAQPADVKIKALQLYDDVVIAGYAKKYNNLYFLKNYKRSSSPKTDLGALLGNIDSREVKKELAEKLQEMKGQRMLSAQVSLVLLNKLNLDEFCKTNAKAINSGPDSFKKVLIDVFDLNYNAKNVDLFTRAGIDLPFDKEKIKNKVNAEVDAYLKKRAPISGNDWYQFEQRSNRIILSVISYDTDKACKLVDHYIDLIKSSPDAKSYFPASSKNVTATQVALNSKLIYFLRNQKIKPDVLLPFIYHLSRREDYLSLNIQAMMCESIPRNWLRDIHNDVKKAVPILLKKYITEFSKIDDPEYAEFYKTAWFVYMTSDNPNTSVNFSDHISIDAIRELSAESPKEDEFIDWLALSIGYHPHFVEYWIGQSYRKKYNETASVIRRRYGRTQSEKLLKLASDFSIKNKLMMTSIIHDRVGSAFSPYNTISKKIINFGANVISDAIEEDIDYGISQDLRYALKIRQSMFAADEDVRLRYALACAKAFKHGIEYVKKGGVIHKNHLENLVAGADLNEEGAKILNQTVIENPSQVVGLTTLAQSLLKYGYIESTVKVLPANKLNDIEVGYTRMDHEEGIDKHWGTLLAKYSNPTHKAKVAMFMVLPDFEIIKPKGGTTYYERIGKVLKLAHEAKSDLSEDPQIEAIVGHFRGKFGMGSLYLFDEYYAKNKSKYNVDYFYDLAVKNKLHSLDARRMMDSIKHAVHRNDEDFINAFIDKSREMVKKNKFQNYDEMEFVDNTIRYTTGSIAQLFGEGENDEQVVKLLPLYRKALALTSLTTEALRNKNKSKLNIAITEKYLAEYIHHELGKKADFKVFFNKYKGEKKHKIFEKKRVYPISFEFMRRGYNKTYYRSDLHEGIPLDSKKLVLRILNNKAYQRDVLSEERYGGALDYAVDHGTYSDEQAIDLLTSGEIKVKEPSFAAVIESDLAHIAALQGRYDDMLVHFKKMNEIFKVNPALKPGYMIRMNTRAITYLNKIGRYEEALAIMPEEVLRAMNEKQTEDYNKLIASVKKKGK